MKILSYIEAHQLIEDLSKKMKSKISDDLSSKIITYSGLLDDWIQALVTLASQKSDISENQAYEYLEKEGYFTILLNQIPKNQQIYLINPRLASNIDWVKINKIINNKNLLFSPLFANWVKKQNLFDSLVNEELPMTYSEEKILKVLFNKINQLVKRDDVGQALWGSQWLEKYSDYMIDTVIYRLRKKIIKPYKIITLKNRGFILSKKSEFTLNLNKFLPIISPAGTYPHSEYIEYMNNPKNIRKTLSDLFLSLKKESVESKLKSIIGNQHSLSIIVINSYSHDNIDAMVNWLSKRHSKDKIIFSHLDDRAIKLHQQRAFDLGLDHVEVLYDDIRKTRLAPGSFNLIINDFRLNFNSNHQQNIATMKNTNKILKAGGFALISVVVDARYESSRFGRDQEKAPINQNAPFTFKFKENLERYCFTIPYYKKLFIKSGFEIVKEFDISEGKTWFSKEKFIPNHEPTYRRFLLKKTGINSVKTG
jgi:DNA-binding winged helix-turn-helix (wHTH) protein